MSLVKVYENGIFNRDEFVIVYCVLGLMASIQNFICFFSLRLISFLWVWVVHREKANSDKVVTLNGTDILQFKHFLELWPTEICILQTGYQKFSLSAFFFYLKIIYAFNTILNFDTQKDNYLLCFQFIQNIHKKTILSYLLQQRNLTKNIDTNSFIFMVNFQKISTEICLALLITKGRSINYYKHMYIVSILGWIFFFLCPMKNSSDE